MAEGGSLRRGYLETEDAASARVMVRVEREASADAAVDLPCYTTAGAAGVDLRANLAVEDRGAGLSLAPLGRVLVPLGFRMALPEGWEMQIRPRSGLALAHGITVLNAPGTVDADYRGPVGVLLVNLGAEPFVVRHGERIAQGVLAAVVRGGFEERPLDATARGAGGFGSTGLS